MATSGLVWPPLWTIIVSASVGERESMYGYLFRSPPRARAQAGVPWPGLAWPRLACSPPGRGCGRAPVRLSFPLVLLAASPSASHHHQPSTDLHTSALSSASHLFPPLRSTPLHNHGRPTASLCHEFGAGEAVGQKGSIEQYFCCQGEELGEAGRRAVAAAAAAAYPLREVRG